MWVIESLRFPHPPEGCGVGEVEKDEITIEKKRTFKIRRSLQRTYENSHTYTMIILV